MSSPIYVLYYKYLDEAYSIIHVFNSEAVARSIVRRELFDQLTLCDYTDDNVLVLQRFDVDDITKQKINSYINKDEHNFEIVDFMNRYCEPLDMKNVIYNYSIKSCVMFLLATYFDIDNLDDPDGLFDNISISEARDLFLNTPDYRNLISKYLDQYSF